MSRLCRCLSCRRQILLLHNKSGVCNMPYVALQGGAALWGQGDWVWCWVVCWLLFAGIAGKGILGVDEGIVCGSDFVGHKCGGPGQLEGGEALWGWCFVGESEGWELGSKR
jgi:hypothetical protein